MISNNRLLHIIAVARLMKEKSQQAGESEEYSNEMFTLGMLHDIGYEFNSENHNEVGADVVRKANYKFWQEIKWHGIPSGDYCSKELDLLNWADMHIDGKGNYVAFEERLKDIETRYGKVSETYTNACKIVEKLKGELWI